MLLITLLDLYSLIVFGAVITSWIQLPPDNAFVRFLDMATEPMLAPIRRVLPTAGGLDFSPLVLLIGLRMLRGLLLSLGSGI